MTSLTIPQVRGWRPGDLETAAQAVKTAEQQVDAEARASRQLIESALVEWRGRDATAAAERAATEARTGFGLADALGLAHAALTAGASDIGTARTKLLDTIADAQEDGFTVSDDGTVTPPTLPPVMTTPEGAAEAARERNREQERLNEKAGTWATDISRALGEVSTVDGDTAKVLMEIDFPQTLESEVRSFLERAWHSRDLLAALGTGAGAAALGLALKDGIRMFGKSRALLSFFKHASAPITDYQTFLRNINASDDALRTFMKGKANGGFLRFLAGSRAARLLGKAFLPLTVLSGGIDALTGGGYDGARGWATRGFGLAGAAGAGTLLLAGAGLVSLGPVGLGIAGVAVVGYGLWSVGNFVWDHREQIGEFLGNARDWTGDRLSDAGEAISDATDWAGDKIDGAVDKAKDLGKSALDTVSFGLL